MSKRRLDLILVKTELEKIKIEKEKLLKEKEKLEKETALIHLSHHFEHCLNMALED